MRDLDKSEVVVLLSGGIDSTACTHFFLEQKFQVSGLFIDFGQCSANLERNAARSIADFFKIKLAEINLIGFNPPLGGYVLARNIFFLTTALMSSKLESGSIAIGIHSGTPYKDCSEHFIDLVQGIFDLYANGTIVVVAPFLTYTKKDIFNYCKRFNVPINLTYSCELGLTQPCGKCATCKDLEVLGVS